MRINTVTLQHSQPTLVQACNQERLSLAGKPVDQIMKHTVSKGHAGAHNGMQLFSDLHFSADVALVKILGTLVLSLKIIEQDAHQIGAGDQPKFRQWWNHI